MFIEVSGLKKSYTTGGVKTEVLKGIDLKLGKGEIGVILGPSGSGKSTLINIIGGVDRGDSGRVIVDETEVSKMNDEELTEYRREIGRASCRERVASGGAGGGGRREGAA